jgi:universal stress protein F
MTLHVKKILVALDGSPRAPRVLDAAVQLARLSGAKLVLYRAITVPPDVRDSLVATSTPATSLEDLLTTYARSDLAKIAESIPAELLDRTVTAFATPWDGICRAAREHDVELVVIGSHGYGRLDRLLGTVAAKVVNHCDRNVLVVRMPL